MHAVQFICIHLTFPIWFLTHDQRGPFFVIFLIFVLLHGYATIFSMGAGNLALKLV
jgi:hypothetical protein